MRRRKLELDRRCMLKVKIKSLAVEAEIIRKEEKKASIYLQSQLHEHRVRDVRFEARHAQLAYAFLRGKKYLDVEPNAKVNPCLKRLGSLVKKYGAWRSYEAQAETWSDFQLRKARESDRLSDWLSAVPQAV